MPLLLLGITSAIGSLAGIIGMIVHRKDMETLAGEDGTNAALPKKYFGMTGQEIMSFAGVAVLLYLVAKRKRWV